jgi:DNA-binding NtrC family response regulator
MKKKLTNYGNKVALIIEKPILELLNIDMDTLLEISTDGKNLIISPFKDTGQDEKVELEIPFIKGQSSSDFIKSYLSMSLKEAKEQFEKDFITRKLKKNKGNISKTAKELNLNRSNLHRKLRNLSLENICTC